MPGQGHTSWYVIFANSISLNSGILGDTPTGFLMKSVTHFRRRYRSVTKSRLDSNLDTLIRNLHNIDFLRSSSLAFKIFWTK